MKDEYKHDSVGVDKILATLKQTRTKYEDQITALNDLASEIAYSAKWKDIRVKTEFMNTYNSYLNIYKDVYTTMERYEKYLEKKSKVARQIEQNYTR